jgi:hypothetical protein
MFSLETLHPGGIHTNDFLFLEGGGGGYECICTCGRASLHKTCKFFSSVCFSCLVRRKFFNFCTIFLPRELNDDHPLSATEQFIFGGLVPRVQMYFLDLTRVARWFIFKPKIPIWVTFGGP